MIGTQTLRSRISTGAVALLCLQAAGCGPAPVAGVALSAPVSGPLERGATVQLQVQLTDASGKPVTGRPVTWSSSDPAVAEVSAEGLLTARGRGSVTLTATSEGVSGQLALQVVILYSSIATGGSYSCDLGSGGVASCWGWNGNGVLGTGAQDLQVLTPASVQGNHAFAALAVSDHSCGITTAGDALCWGSNSGGELGTGDNLGPRRLPTPVIGGHKFASISAGGAHTCAVTTGGQAYCWGQNSHGQLGNGSTAINVPTPTAVAGGLTFKSISAGTDFSCGVTRSNDAYCWGLDAQGQLGDGGPITGSTTSRSLVPVRVVGGIPFEAVSASFQFACGLTNLGVAHCWGRNEFRLGDNGTNDASEPVPVAGMLKFTSLSAGATHTCGVTTGGAVFCWGANHHGELGVASPADLSRQPVRVTNFLTFSEVSAAKVSGSNHTCGITSERLAVYCWGRNTYGQLGNGAQSSARREEPQQVRGQHP